MNPEWVIEAAREVRDADHELAQQQRHGSLHDQAMARMRFHNALNALDLALEGE